MTQTYKIKTTLVGIAAQIEADTAVSAVAAAAKAAGYPANFASLTARHQRAGDPAVRDNAYAQIDRAGHKCIVAERVEALEILAKLDAKSDELWKTDYRADRDSHAIFNDYMRSLCGLIEPATNDALGYAGFAKFK